MTFIFSLFSGNYLSFCFVDFLRLTYSIAVYIGESSRKTFQSEVIEDLLFFYVRNLRITSNFAHKMAPIKHLRIFFSNLE